MNSKWIPVTESLPSDRERVLTYSPSTPWWFSYDDEPCIVVGFRHEAYSHWFFSTDTRNARIEPTHWMPLPEAPKTKDVL